MIWIIGEVIYYSNDNDSSSGEMMLVNMMMMIIRKGNKNNIPLTIAAAGPVTWTISSLSSPSSKASAFFTRLPALSASLH